MKNDININDFLADSIDSFIRINCPVCGGSSFDRILTLTPRIFLSENRKKYYNLRSIGVNEDTPFHFVRCKKCTFVFVNPRFKEHLEKVIYNAAKVGQYDEKKWMFSDSDVSCLFNTHEKVEHFRPFLESILYFRDRFRRVKNIDKSRIKLLDYGCGFGHILELCSVFGIDAFGVDIDEKRLDICRKKGLKVFKPEQLDDTNKFDVVVSTSVIEHVNNLPSYFEYIGKRTIKGSIFSFNGLTPKIIDIEKNKGVYNIVMPLEHINFFTPKSLKIIAGRYGFRRVGRQIIVKPIENFGQYFVPFVRMEIFKGFYPEGEFKVDMIKITD